VHAYPACLSSGQSDRESTAGELAPTVAAS